MKNKKPAKSILKKLYNYVELAFLFIGAVHALSGISKAINEEFIDDGNSKHDGNKGIELVIRTDGAYRCKKGDDKKTIAKAIVSINSFQMEKIGPRSNDSNTSDNEDRYYCHKIEPNKKGLLKLIKALFNASEKI